MVRVDGQPHAFQRWQDFCIAASEERRDENIHRIKVITIPRRTSWIQIPAIRVRYPVYEHVVDAINNSLRACLYSLFHQKDK